MTAMVRGGETVMFWLTQRLCYPLVRVLTHHLESSESSSALVDHDLFLSCQQRAAVWQHEPSEPVTYSAGSLMVLPDKVGMKCSEQGAALLFPIGDGKEALLQMNQKELRQWLAIVYRQFKTAGWSMDVWPDWFMLTEFGRN